MKKLLFFFTLFLAMCDAALAQRFTDNLGRGLVAVPTGSTSGSTTNFISWRRLADEYYGVTYNLYKNGTKIASNLTKTSYDDNNSATTTTNYQVAAVVNGVEQPKCAAVTPWTQYVYKLGDTRTATGYLDIALAAVYDRNGSDVTNNYEPNDAEMADLDGDGELEIIIKRLNTFDASAQTVTRNGTEVTECYPDESTQFAVFDAYDVNWQTGAATLMWRIDVGPNMVSLNSTELNLIAYDWDEDGKAEVVLRGADNMIIYGSDGRTQLFTVGNMTANYRNFFSSTDWQYSWICFGREYLIYMNGETGAKYQVQDYPLPRLEQSEWPNSSVPYNDYEGLKNVGVGNYFTKNSGTLHKAWGDNYGHRSSKYFFGAPFLDGREASLFLARGIYTRHKMIAMNLDKENHTWSTRWTWSNNSSGSEWYGQGYHNFVIADVDEDGRDEIVYGSMVIDDNGKGLSTTGLGHGDAQHVSDFDPYRPGLEFFGCNEDKPAMNYRNATTSQLYVRTTASDDDGRALMANFSNDYPGSMGRSVSSGMYSSVKDQTIDALENYIEWGDLNFRIYFDGDLCSEILNSPGTAREAKIEKPGTGRLFTSSGCNMNNDSKNNPCFQGDIIGDWREEIIVRHYDTDLQKYFLRVYTTGIGTNYTLPCLWYDHQYRQAMVWQMMAYNQPPHLSYFLGELEGITVAPPPLTNCGRTEIAKDGTIGTSLNGKHVLICDNNSTASSFTIAEGAQPSVLTVNTPKWVQGNNDNNSIVTKNDYVHTLKGAALTGTTRLTKQGGGTLRLNNITHTYTGKTDVWGGTFSFDGTLQNSALWLNRFTTLRSNGGTFNGGITADYGSTIIPGGENNQGTITTTTLTLNHGARLLLDVYNDLTADKVNATTLTINTKTGENWVNYGPQYLKPVIEIVAHGALPYGTYDLGTVGTLSGSINDIVLEGIIGATLDYTNGHLCLVIGNGIATFCEEPVIAESSLQTTNEGIQLPEVNATVQSFSIPSGENVFPDLSASFTDLQGYKSEINATTSYYSQNYEQENDAATWVTKYATLELATDNANGKHIKVIQGGGSGPRSAYSKFFDSTPYIDCNAYTIEFDAYFHYTHGNYDANELILYGEGASMPSSNALFGNSNYIFKIAGGNNYGTSYTVEGTTSSYTLNDGTWYHYTIGVNKPNKRVTYSITGSNNTKVGSGSYIINNNAVSMNVQGIFVGLGRAWSYAGVDNINVYSKDHFTYKFTSPGTLTVTSSYEGCVSVNTDYEAKFVGVTIGDSGWATFGCNYPLDFSGSGKPVAYTASPKDDTSVTLTPVTSVPAATGLLLKGADGTYRMPISTNAGDIGTNLLHAVTTADGYTVNSADIYVLANKTSNGLGFYPCAQQVVVPVGRAYLQLDGGARTFIGFGDQATDDISVICQDSDLQAPYFTPAGVRTDKPRKGLYIRNHKKVIVK